MAYDENIQALLSAASIVRDETHEGGNTAARVGQLLMDMITSFDSAYKALSDSIPEGVDLSILKSYLSKEEAETLFDTQSVFNRLFVEDTTNNAIKALKHLYSVSDITAFGYVKTELPSEGVGSFGELSEVLALGAQSGTKYWGWNGTDYAWLSAPAGGAVDLSEYPKRNEFAALTLKVNGLYEQYLPLGTSIGLDLDAVYAKKGEGGNVNLDDYYKKTEITTLLEGYVTNDTLVTTVKDVKVYTDAQISALNIDQYATNQALTDAINGAKNYADEKFVTLNTEQEITAAKKFVSMYDFFGTQSDGIYFYNHDPNGVLIGHYGNNYYGDESYLQFRNGDWKGYVQFMNGIVGNVNVKNGGIEIFDTKPYIDFHYGNSTEDLTSRIWETASGVLELFSSSYSPGTLKIGNAYLTYDSDNNALFVKGKDGASVNLVATGDVAAYSGLGSGFDTLTDLTLTNKLTVKDIQASNKITAKSIDAQYLSVSNSMQQSIDMGECDIDNCQNFTCQYMFADEINLGSDQITELSASGSYMYITINGTRYRISATKV